MSRKILIIGPAWVGDMVMAQTLFMLLQHREPDVAIDVLAPAWSAPLLSRMPEVSKFIEIAITHGELKLRERYQIAKTLRANGYDQAIILPNSFKSALIPWWAKIPVRTGWLRELRGLLLNDGRRLNEKKYPLMIERCMALALATNESLPNTYPRPALCVNTELQQAALHKHGLSISNRPILALCPGAEFGPSKRWPEEYFAEVAAKKMAEGWDIWIFGSAKDKEVVAKIIGENTSHITNLAGRTSLAEAIDLLSLVTGVVTNDSGLMHIAAALNKPLIALYGSTSPGFTPPLTPAAKILMNKIACQPCFKRDCPLQHHRCMRELKPEQVLTSLAEWQN